ncbi:GatB/YqeY domain-containing protein [Candidatus Uhrbacteria bacterium]|nr:GatB/YqeY domain-containing protein [Candidatus Uhrbacteria bacterium]
MPLAQQIEEELKQAMKAKDELMLSTLRMVRSSLKNKQIDIQRELADDDVVAVLKTMVKQYRDALADFEKAGRTDLAEKQKQEIAVLERYLPAPMAIGELEPLCARIIAEETATSADVGKVMGRVMKEVGGRADGNTVRAIVQRLLSG